MKRNERINDETIAALTMLEGWQAGLWTALPGIIESVNLAERTVTVQPSIQAQFTSGKEKQWVTMPLLLDCPLVFPGAGGFVLTFPVKQGDECLVVFSSRCIDSWWQSGGVQPQADLRMHDLSDGFVIPGVCSKPKVQPSISSANVQLRNDAGTALVEITPAGNVNITTAQQVNVTSTGNTTITAPLIKLEGNVQIDGNVTHNGNLNRTGNETSTGTIQNNGKDVGSTHYHTAQGATANTTTAKP